MFDLIMPVNIYCWASTEAEQSETKLFLGVLILAILCKNLKFDKTQARLVVLLSAYDTDKFNNLQVVCCCS